MASECKSRLFWSIFFPSLSFRLVFNLHGYTSSRPPVLKRSLGTPLILYSQSIYFRGSPLEFLSFPALRSRYRLSLCSTGIHSSHAIPDETRQFSLFRSLFIFLFCIFLHILFLYYTLSKFFFLRYSWKYAHGTQCKIWPIYENKIIYIVAGKNKDMCIVSNFLKRHESSK